MPVTVEIAVANGAAGERSELEDEIGFAEVAARARGAAPMDNASTSAISGRKRLMPSNDVSVSPIGKPKLIRMHPPILLPLSLRKRALARRAPTPGVEHRHVAQRVGYAHLWDGLFAA